MMANDRTNDKLNRTWTWIVRGLACLAWLLSSSTNCGPCWAQSTWEVTPYQGQVWWVIDDRPNLPPAWREAYPQQLEQQLRAMLGAAWQGTVSPAPEQVGPRLLGGEEVSLEDIYAAAPKVQQLDKLFLVIVRGTRSGYQVQVRELDCHLHHWGPQDTATVRVLHQIGPRVSQMIADAFSPVVRIERTTGGVAKTRLRAGALIQTANHPARLAANDVLLPFDRRVNRGGVAQPSAVKPVDWTYLLVEQPTPESGAYMLKIVSGFRQPFRSKRSRKLQQLALRARPRYDQSIVRLQSRSKTPQPLIGYEIHEKGKEATQFLGHTDWQGEMVVGRAAEPIRTLLVRSGQRVTAKLPIVPGLRQTVVASMLDDSQRLATEGFLSGIQTSLIDLVAQRESLSSRIQRRISEGDLDQAERLLRQFRDLPSQDDFRREIQQQQQALTVDDTRLRRRIDTMFVNTYRTLGKYLDGKRLRMLENQLTQARAAAN